MVVVNASNRFRDVDWMHEQREKRRELDVSVRDISDETGMIAIQGPNAASDCAVDLRRRPLKIAHYHFGVLERSPECRSGRSHRLHRRGRLRVYVPDRSGAASLGCADGGRQGPGPAPIGLGARDTLRLEARMPLYGHELATTSTPSRPVSAGRSSSTRATSSAAKAWLPSRPRDRSARRSDST